MPSKLPGSLWLLRKIRPKVFRVGNHVDGVAGEDMGSIAKTQGIVALITAAREVVLECSVEQVWQGMQTDAEAIVIDVREDREWHEGHLPNAIHLSRGVIEWLIPDVVPDPQQRVILYCGIGQRSLLAGQSLRALGYTQVYSLTGGIAAWLAAGYPIVQESV